MDIEQLKTQPERFLNRELSWLSFNMRVLEEARNPQHPLLERLRFLSICASNFDEFYMVRVAGLMGQVSAGVTERSIDGLTPKQQLSAIEDKAAIIIKDLHNTWKDLQSTLKEHDIDILGQSDLNAKDRHYLSHFFYDEIMPVLTPIALDPAHPFPFIPNKGLAIVMQMHDHETAQDLAMLIQIPNMLDRFISLPASGTDKARRYIPIEKVIMRNLEQIFPAHMEVLNYATFRIIRDSEMEIEEEAEDLVRTFESALKRRRRGHVVTLSVHHTIHEDLLDFLRGKLNIEDHQTLRVDGLVGLADTSQIIDSEHRPELLFKPFDARFPERIREYSGDCFAAIRQKDIIVHHPYESFDVVVQFLRQAARDPQVVSIKQTLYRTSHDSPIVGALIQAAENGKSVTALVELKARFDEEANIRWARDMERAGVQVVYGFLDLKTHAKVSLITRREGGNLRSYGHFGTGNYHPTNARVYTDLSYFTCDPELCRDAGRLFNYMTGYATPQGLEALAISPLNLRETLINGLDKEIAFAKAGKPAAFWGKCNAVLDSQMVDKLYEASQAGVQIDLVVRGICTLRPGIPGLSENIRVKSMVGRFLEHARVYCFGNGHGLPSGKAKVYISSADLMARNLSRRIEALVPIDNKTVHQQVLNQIMVANLKDRKQSWLMHDDGSYERIKAGEDAFCAHDYFMINPSLSGRGKALGEVPMPPSLKLDKQKKLPLRANIPHTSPTPESQS